MDFATVYSDFNAAEAQLVYSRLEAAGFHPFMKNENAPFYLQGLSAASSVHVQVLEAEAAAALEFLTAPNPPSE